MASGFDSLIKWGLVAGGAYLIYEWFFASPAVPASTPVPASGAGFHTSSPTPSGTALVPVSAGGGPAPVSQLTPVIPISVPVPPAPPAAPPAPAFNSLDATYQRLVQTGGSQPLTFSQWNYTLGAVSNLTGLPTYQDVFGSPDPNTPITSAQYWSGMSAWLAKNRGLSGYGVYGGLAALARQSRRLN